MIRREQKGEVVRVTFALPKEEPAGRVSVVGNFNDWTPCTHSLVRRANGTRSVAPIDVLIALRYNGSQHVGLSRTPPARNAAALRKTPPTLSAFVTPSSTTSIPAAARRTSRDVAGGLCTSARHPRCTS